MLWIKFALQLCIMLKVIEMYGKEIGQALKSEAMTNYAVSSGYGVISTYSNQCIVKTANVADAVLTTWVLQVRSRNRSSFVLPAPAPPCRELCRPT